MASTFQPGDHVLYSGGRTEMHGEYTVLSPCRGSCHLGGAEDEWWRIADDRRILCVRATSLTPIEPTG